MNKIGSLFTALNADILTEQDHFCHHQHLHLCTKTGTSAFNFFFRSHLYATTEAKLNFPIPQLQQMNVLQQQKLRLDWKINNLVFLSICHQEL